RKRTGRKGNSYQALVRTKKNGRYYSLTKTFSKKVLAVQWARDKEYDIERGQYADLSAIEGVTVRACIDRYIKEVSPIKPIGKSKLAVLRRVQRSSIADEQIGTLETGDIVAFCVQRKSVDGAEPATITQDVIYLSGVVKMAMSVWGFPIKSNPVEDAKAFLIQKRLIGKPKQRERRPTAAELEAFRQVVAANKRIRLPMCDLVEFAIASAFRLGEICRITWEDLDSDKGTILIRDRKDPNQKIGNNQCVPLSSEALEVIARQPRFEERIFPVDARSVSTVFTRQCKKAGIEDLHFHDLRHEGTSRLFERGLEIQQVAMITGHKSWSMLQRYTHLKPADVVSRLNET
ncbi:integrase, partial [Sansalvadorimonas verongulae]|uniref:integrase n=1 Tax=Sansalvadorimonas verongulae TaxID=2172824 RepID=UPI001E602168